MRLSVSSLGPLPTSTETSLIEKEQKDHGPSAPVERRTWTNMPDRSPAVDVTPCPTRFPPRSVPSFTDATPQTPFTMCLGISWPNEG